MNEISMPYLRKIGLIISYLIGCAGLYLGSIFLVVWIFLDDLPWPIQVVSFLLFIAGLMILPFWYKIFFVKDFIGLGFPYYVCWSNTQILFKGFCFEIDVPIQNVIFYKTIGFTRCEYYFLIKLKVKTLKGKVETVYLSTGMRNKKLFLEHLGKIKGYAGCPGCSES